MHTVKVLSATLAALVLSAGATFAQLDRAPVFAAYAQLSSAASVTVTKFSSLPDAHGDTESAIFGGERDDDLMLLRKNVSGSSAAMAALTAAGYSAADVVALKALSDGAITLYVNDL